MEEETITFTETRMLYLSTKSSQCQLLNGDYKSRVQYDLRSYLDFQGDDTIQSVGFSLTSAILCNSNYQINENNNRLDILYNGSPITYYFPFGNYAADTFMQTWTTLLPSSFTIEFNQVNLRFTIKNTLYPFVLLDTSTIDYVMGFSETLYSTESSPYTVVCNRLCNFLPIPCFRILVESNNIYCGTVLGANGQSAYSNVLANIPNGSKPNQIIYYQSISDEFKLQEVGTTQLILSITDDNGNLINFNGIASFFQFRIRIYRKQKRSLISYDKVLANATNKRFEQENKTDVIEKHITELFK